MSYWHGTRLRTGWMHLRGAGHVRDWRLKPFFCVGCNRTHGKSVERNRTLDGILLCNRRFYEWLAGAARGAASVMAQIDRNERLMADTEDITGARP